MVLQKTLWSPDTCGCQIELSWDDSVSEAQRTHDVSRVVKSCPAHSQHADKAVLLEQVLDENQSKNRAIGLLISLVPKLQGKELEIKWKIEADRSITISHPSLNADEKASVNAMAKTGIKKQMRVE